MKNSPTGGKNGSSSKTAAKSAPAKKAGTANAGSNGKANGSAGQKSSAKNSPAKNAPAQPGNNAGQIKAKSDAAAGLTELFEASLKDIYWAEKALTKALPKMAKNATDPQLVSAIQDHLAVTQNQISRLEGVFASIGKKAQAKKCEAMDGLLKEGQEIMEETESGVVRDAGIIAAAQKVEHYEIATYGTLRVFARTLGNEEAAVLLEETLAEEKECDSLLTGIAEGGINSGAKDEDGENNNGDNDQQDRGSDDKKKSNKK